MDAGAGNGVINCTEQCIYILKFKLILLILTMHNLTFKLQKNIFENSRSAVRNYDNENNPLKLHENWLQILHSVEIFECFLDC